MRNKPSRPCSRPRTQQVAAFQLDVEIIPSEADRRELKYRWIHLILMWLAVFSLAEMKTARADVKSLDGTIKFDSNFDGAPEAILNSTGFGLGTTTPSANIQVNGNAIVSGTMVVGGTSNASGSNLHLNGSMGFSVQTVTVNTTLSGNSVVLADTSAGNITLTLPIVSTVNGRIYTIKKIHQSNVLILNGGGNNIDSNGEYFFSSGNLASMQVVSSGTQWHVFRASDRGLTVWTPADFNPLAWWDASDTSTISKGSSGNVYQWNDKSSNNYHVTQSTANYQPTSGTNTIGGKNVLNWGSVANQKFLEVTLGSTNTMGDWYIVTSFAHTVFSSTDLPGLLCDQTMDYRFFTGSSNAWVSYGRANNYYLNGIDITSTRVVMPTLNSPGIVSASRNTPISCSMLQIGDDTTPPSSPRGWQGFISEVICFNSKRSEADRQKIEGYLAWKWRLETILPSNHPYKNFAP